MKKTILGLVSGMLVFAFALPALAANTFSAADLACVQTAVDARETTIGTAFNTYSTAMASALSARKAALHTAWGMTDNTARRTARNAAWSTFKTASKAAHRALKASRHSAWATFRTASAACHVPAVEAQGQDTEGNLNL